MLGATLNHRHYQKPYVAEPLKALHHKHRRYLTMIQISFLKILEKAAYKVKVKQDSFENQLKSTKSSISNSTNVDQ